MKLFISHAVADAQLATKFVDMIQLGMGVSHADIFLSSSKGSIPNGQFFVQHILKEMNNADMVITLLSRSYLASQFCLAEAGSALARQTAGNCEFFSLVIPPLAFRDLDGVLYGVQSGSLLDRPALGELKDLICAKLTTKPPGSHIWDQKRDDFLKVAAHAASRYLAEEDVKRIAIVRYEWERDDSPTITFHTKLRIVLKNETSNAFEIESALWSSGSVGVPLFDASQPIKWQLKRGDPEKIPIHVPAGSEAHTWIGISDSVNFPDCLNRCASKRTGTLHLMVKINHLVSHELHF